jgi:hypothetical protein
MRIAKRILVGVEVKNIILRIKFCLYGIQDEAAPRVWARWLQILKRYCKLGMQRSKGGYHSMDTDLFSKRHVASTQRSSTYEL